MLGSKAVGPRTLSSAGPLDRFPPGLRFIIRMGEQGAGGGDPISTLLTSARVLLGKGKTSRSPPPHPFPNSPPCRLTRWDVFRKPAHSCGPAAGVQAVRWLGDRFLRPEPAQRAARHGRGSVHHCRLRGTSFAPGSRESAAVAECGDATAATATRAIRLIKKRREEKT